jgi:hypothetical protein
VAHIKPKACGLFARIVTLEGVCERDDTAALWTHQAETIAEGIAAKGDGGAAGRLEFLLAFGARVQGPRQSGFEIVDMEIDVDRRPMALVSANIVAANRGFRACPFLHDPDLRVSAFEDDVLCNRPRDLGEFKGVAIEAKTVFEARNIDADGVPHDNAPLLSEPAS